MHLSEYELSAVKRAMRIQLQIIHARRELDTRCLAGTMILRTEIGSSEFLEDIALHYIRRLQILDSTERNLYIAAKFFDEIFHLNDDD